MNLLITGAWQDAKEHIPELEVYGHSIAFLQQERDALPCDLSWIEGVICNGLFLYHPIESFSNLRFIQLTSAGYDRVPMDYVQAHGIEIHSARGVYSIPMAEFAVAEVLAHYKGLYQFHDQQKRHEWIKNRNLRELAGKKVVIVGCGDVGLACARRFQAFECRIVGVNRTIREVPYFDQVVSLEQLDNQIENSDIVIVTIALTETTKGLVKARLMKKDAVLVNISRGATVDLSDTECQTILDVFEEEPLEESSNLWDSAIITPHNSFVGEGNARRLTETILKTIDRL